MKMYNRLRRHREPDQTETDNFHVLETIHVIEMGCRVVNSHKPSHIYEDVFSAWLHSDQYLHWKRDDVTWQLRCIGGPGSGKTTFSSQVVNNLRKSFPGTNTAVVSLYLQHANVQDASGSELSCVNVVLTEIEEQLRPLVDSGSQGRRASLVGSEATTGVLRRPDCADHLRMIASHIKSFDRVFLVIDDLDLAWVNLKEYLELENVLANLKTLGIKILATSRVPFKNDTDLGVCDVNKDHKPINLWWECSACVGEEYYICDICREAGHRCPKSDHADTQLVQPREKIQLDIGNPPLRGFLKYFLEQEHGDLGFGSHVNLLETELALPPWSILGHELVNPVNENAAMRLVDDLVQQSNGNIALSLLRLEHISEAASLEEARAIADRLPRNIVEAFNSGMLGIANSPARLYRDLGLVAIKAVGDHGGWLTFQALKEQLKKEWVGDIQELETLLDSEYGLEEVLAASHGFLWPKESREAAVEFYHYNFELYITENYAERFNG